jgi:GNAT superfamily N-acetyltransferase
VETVLLNKSVHDRTGFDCGILELNNFFKAQANQQYLKDNSRTFVLEDETKPHYVVGFYTLTMTPIDLGELPQKLQAKHRGVSSGGLIARLAIDKRFQGKGLGEWLLIDALKKLLQASDVVAFPVVIVDAKDGASGFYEQYGFNSFTHQKQKMFMTMTDIRKTLD